MLNSSSTSNFDRDERCGLTGADFRKRLGRFLIPFLALPFIGFVLFLTGEFVPARIVAWAHSKGYPVIFLQKYSDHNFALKVAAANELKPDVLVLGSSRTNQWRSKHFEPYSFYNAGNISARNADLTEFLDRLTYNPRVIIFSIDFFMFTDAWSPQSDNVLKEDISFPDEAAYILRGLVGGYLDGTARLIPNLREPVYGSIAIGLQASQSGNGFRKDGSYQYGTLYRGSSQGLVSVSVAKQRIEDGTAPFLFASAADGAQIDAFQRFVKKAKAKGISLVGVTTAFDPSVVSAMEASSKHQLWRTFRSKAFRSWLDSLGVVTFDFTELSSFNGRPEEFIDTFHPSEPAFSRQLVTMLTRKEFSTLLPKLNVDHVRSALSHANAFEVYRNQF